jgi:hypothetical protein
LKIPTVIVLFLSNIKAFQKLHSFTNFCLITLIILVSIVSLGAFAIKSEGFITVNNGSNRFLAFHSKITETHYNLSTYSNNWKIVASIDEPMPASSKLLIQVSSKKGTSLGVIDLSDGIPKSVVVGFGKAIETDQRISCTVISGTRLGRTVTLNLRAW